ncbi:hypothetical protein ACFUPZ_05340 [Microbacterium oxydans]|uniref:hypothetical protein n=1 Tax=Microbacterium oxydans TaxID=82380 RepID=UPI00363B75F4
MKTKEQALRDLGRVVADAVGIAAKLTVREAAERVWRADGPSIDVLMQRIAATGICRTEAAAS